MTATIDKQTRGLDEAGLDLLFREARTANSFLPIPVPQKTLENVVETTKLAPTSMNALPLRVTFITSDEGKARLKAHVWPGNVAKVESAPVIAILARDLAFYEELPRLFPHAPQQYFDGAKAAADPFSALNATLQAGYFILAARAHGLDVGPMGGFDNAGVDNEFSPDGAHKSIVLVALGYGDDSKLFPRNPRLELNEIAEFV